MKDLEGRIRKVEQAIRVARGRAVETQRPGEVRARRRHDRQLEAGIAETQAKLDKAGASGDARRTKDLEADLANKQAFLDMARQASAEFG